MPKRPNERIKYSMACACGAKISVDARSFGRLVVCRSCGASVKVEWGKDRRGRKGVPVAVPQMRTRVGVRPDQTPMLAQCICGYTRPVPLDSIGSTPLCPGCGKKMFVESSAHPEIRISVTPGTQAFECPCGLRLLLGPSGDERTMECPECHRRIIVEVKAPVTLTDKPIPGKPFRTRAPVRAPVHEPGPGECVCACGAFIPPRTSRTGKSFTCSACGRQGHVEMEKDPDTGKPVLRAVIDGGQPPAAGR